ncbi:TonB family protein [Sphingomonas sp. RIT328]|uniref:TonB family protein n=1 Tax=Sphingomonas sp. RIT328 TaxID=1470591 RepID=UPI0004514DE6|nr:TonB family protein [Sphingomonas sp. RIT328]EZP51170.1 hypothetical protein BW41_02825 [Sphingomonas sp. RIT328]
MLAPPLPPPPSLVSPFGSDSAVVQLAGSGTAGTGAGEGSGVGLGAGSGAGGDGKAHYAKASWIYRPTDAELRRFWPAEAVRRHISGRVILACAVPRSGRPERCVVLIETPADMGFGAAALAMQPLFRIRPVLRNGKVVALPILVPVAFDTPPLRKR